MEMTLKLTNNVTKKEYVFSVTDIGDSAMFYHFTDFMLEDGMDDGEYTYMLTDSGETLNTGLLQVGTYERENKKTYSENKQYKQYNG